MTHRKHAIQDDLQIFLVAISLTNVSVQILKINPEKEDIDSFVAADFELIGYNPHQRLEMKMAV